MSRTRISRRWWTPSARPGHEARKNEKVDELFDQGRSTTDPAKRRTIYADLARLMVEDATWVFLMQQADIYAARDRLGWTPRADQWLLFGQATVK